MSAAGEREGHLSVAGPPQGAKAPPGGREPRAAGERGGQKGAAILMAMLTVTLVASLAAAAMWQQWRNLEVETAHRSRVQAQWILTGAQDWARLILREDARTGGADHLAEVWAVPLQEARLSTFLAADNSNTVDPTDTAPEAFLSGQIIDLQSRLNLFNLVENGKVSEPALRALSKLFELLELPPRELAMLAENLRFALDTSTDNRSGAAAALVPQRVEQVAWLGLPLKTVYALKPFVTLLPMRTPVNLNTASAEVLYASIESLDMASAQRLVTLRSRTHFTTLAEAGRALPELASHLTEAQHSTTSRFFEVRGRLRQDRVVSEERSVVQRDGLLVKTLWREHDVDP